MYEPSNISWENSRKIKEYVSSFKNTLRVSTTYSNAYRIGIANMNKKRAIMLVMKSEDDKDKIMANLKNLKDPEEF